MVKKNSHPEYHPIKVSCSCGNSFTTKSTYKGDSLHLEICNACHPFYTGQQKLVDTSGRVENFNKKYEKQIEAREKAIKERERLDAVEKKVKVKPEKKKLKVSSDPSVSIKGKNEAVVGTSDKKGKPEKPAKGNPSEVKKHSKDGNK